MTSESFAPSDWVMLTRAASPSTRDRGARADHVDDVGAVGAVDDHRVGLAVAGRPADRAGEVDVDLGDVGAGQVVDRDRVGAAQRVERRWSRRRSRSMTMLPRLRVNSARAAVGRGREDLVAVAAVEQHRVGAVLALDRVAAVARIPLEHVVAGAEEGGVVALLAVDEVVAVAAEQQVGAVAAEDGVVAGAAVDRDADQRGEVAGGREAVVAAVHVDDELLGGADVEREGRGIERGRSARACRWR